MVIPSRKDCGKQENGWEEREREGIMKMERILTGKKETVFLFENGSELKNKHSLNNKHASILLREYEKSELRCKVKKELIQPLFENYENEEASYGGLIILYY